jgi:DNA polymerase III subunit epsilon
MAIHHLPISETPIAIVDIETTGLNAGSDRIVEISVVRCDPGSEPKLILDTLVNPLRRMGATEIHGITDADVQDAPPFSDIADILRHALSGCVVAAYNVYFDMRFIEYELSNCGKGNSMPHFCLMYMRPLLGLGSRCCLSDACSCHNVSYSHAHMASSDAMACAHLYRLYLDSMACQGIGTFGDLAHQGSYKFLRSFDFDPIEFSPDGGAQFSNGLRSRSGMNGFTVEEQQAIPQDSPEARLHEGLVRYWDALKSAVTDLMMTDEEVKQLKELEAAYNLTTNHIRFLHARVFSAVISQFIEDQELDDRESRKLKRLHQCLSNLGWAPGE